MHTFKCVTVGAAAVLLLSSLALGQKRPNAQEAAREVRKETKQVEKALREKAKDNAKEVRKALKPGTKPPQGKDQQRGEFDIASLRAHDFGMVFGKPGPGLIVEQLDNKGALADSGLQEGDRILEVDGHRVAKEGDFMKRLFAEDVRSGKVMISVLREEDTQELIVLPGKLLEQLAPGHRDRLSEFGVTLGDRAPNRLRVVDVVRQTDAEAVGLKRGDIILVFDGVEVKSAEALRKAFDQAQPGEHELVVAREQTEKSLKVQLK